MMENFFGGPLHLSGFEPSGNLSDISYLLLSTLATSVNVINYSFAHHPQFKGIRLNVFPLVNTVFDCLPFGTPSMNLWCQSVLETIGEVFDDVAVSIGEE